MIQSDSEIDLNSIDRAIYLEDIRSQNKLQKKSDVNENTARCITKDEKYKISNTDDINYYKYFIVRQTDDPAGEETYDLSDIQLDTSYDRNKNLQNSGNETEFNRDWKSKLTLEKEFLKNSIIASSTFKYMKSGGEKTIYNPILDDISGCFFVYPYIEKKEEKNKYNILFPEKISIPINDTVVDGTFIMTSNDFHPTGSKHIKREIIDFKSENIKDKIDEIFSPENRSGINYIEYINSIIDNKIYNEFANILTDDGKKNYSFEKNIINNDDEIETTAANTKIYSNQINKEDKLIQGINKIKPLHIIPKIYKIDTLHRQIEKFVQDEIDNFLNENIPKIYRTNTNFVCKKIIISSIYFTNLSYSTDESNINSISTSNDFDKFYYKVTSDQKTTIENKINILKDNEKLATRSVQEPDLKYHYFTIQVKFPICNSHPIRLNLTDAVINKSVIIIILSYLIGIFLHGAISCCLEFWLNYGDCIKNIYVTNTCANIGNGENRISLIDNYFKWRLTNFPYKKCVTKGPMLNLKGGEVEFNKKKIFYPAIKKENTICLKEDIVEIHKNKRPFPYSMIDYGEENFDSESIKIFFRYIVTLILLIMLPFRYFFNNFLTKSSNIYRKYVAESKFLSILVFVLLPICIPIISLLLIFSLCVTFILFLIYIIFSLIHNISHIISPIFVRDENNEINFSSSFMYLIGVICAFVSLYFINALIFPCRNKDINSPLSCSLVGLGDAAKVGLAFLFFFISLSVFVIKSLIATKSINKKPVQSQPQLNKMENFLKNESKFSDTYFNWIYKILFSMFEYNKLNNEGKEELQNYRVTHYVARDNNIKKQPLYDYLKTDNFNFSIKRFCFILLILLIVALFTGDFKNVDPQGNPRIIGLAVFIGFVLFLYINFCLRNNIFLIFKDIKKTGSQYNPYYGNKDGPILKFFKRFCLSFFCDFDLLFSDYNTYNENYYKKYVSSLANFTDDKLNSTNSLNIWYKKIIDLSEFILLLKKILYIFCSFIIIFITSLALPIVLLLTLIFICFNLLYIFLIVPFVKGGHFFFKIMKNRSKILTYMLCTSVILAINQRQIFGNNTSIVVYTMSGILGILIIYNLFNA